MVSIITPAYKNPAGVETLLASLRKVSLRTIPHEIVVVDDGSHDPAFERVCAQDPNSRLISLPRNQGAAAARNAGARAAKYDLLLFLDSDLTVQTDLLGIATDMFRSPGLDAAVGAFSDQPSNPGPFTNFWALVKAYSLPRDAYSTTFYPAVGVVRKSVFERVDGFCERIKGASVEDFEISVRFRAQNVTIHYNPNLLVKVQYHGILRSLRQSFSRSKKWFVLFWESRAFDNHTTTPGQGVGVLAGAALAASLAALGLGLSVGSPVTVAALIAYAISNRSFFRYVGAKRGWGFVPVAVPLHLVLSLAVTAGVSVGLMHALRGAEHRRAVLYDEAPNRHEQA